MDNKDKKNQKANVKCQNEKGETLKLIAYSLSPAAGRCVFPPLHCPAVDEAFTANNL
jgi:hypothetical protein